MERQPLSLTALPLHRRRVLFCLIPPPAVWFRCCKMCAISRNAVSRNPLFQQHRSQQNLARTGLVHMHMRRAHRFRTEESMRQPFRAGWSALVDLARVRSWQRIQDFLLLLRKPFPRKQDHGISKQALVREVTRTGRLQVSTRRWWSLERPVFWSSARLKRFWLLEFFGHFVWSVRVELPPSQLARKQRRPPNS